jgi:hypothetical protein
MPCPNQKRITFNTQSVTAADDRKIPAPRKGVPTSCHDCRTKQKESDAQLPGKIENDLFRNRGSYHAMANIDGKNHPRPTVAHRGRASKVFLGFVILHPYCKDMPCVDGSRFPSAEDRFPHETDGNCRKSYTKKHNRPASKKITRHPGKTACMTQKHYRIDRFSQSKAINSTSPHAAT